MEGLQDKPEERDLAVIGRIIKPWGISGEALVEPLTFDVDRFFRLKKVALNKGGQCVWMKVNSIKKVGNNLIIGLEGIDSPEDILPFKNSYIKISREESPPLPEGVYYHYQIEGLEVFLQEGRQIGRVKSIIQAGGADVYVIRDDDGYELLIPAIKDTIIKIDLPNNKMIVRPLEMI